VTGLIHLNGRAITDRIKISIEAAEVPLPSSVVRTFSDPDDYTAAIRGAQAEVTVTGRGEFTAKLVRIDLHRYGCTGFPTTPL
jgi:hypothetical protein